jgi:hypothetical protein
LTSLYGDDGQMQCGSCRIDFKTMSPEEVIQAWLRRFTPPTQLPAVLSTGIPEPEPLDQSNYELLKNHYPSFLGSDSAVSLRSLIRLLAHTDRRSAELEVLLRRIREWDHLDMTGDGRHWKHEIDALIKQD